MHGASSAWFRLKWITDFAALVHDMPQRELERLYWRSQELRAGRAAGQALLLAESLFGALRGAAALSEKLRDDYGIRVLHRAALHQLAGHAEPREPTERTFGTLNIHWTQLLLQPGWSFKAGEMLRQLRAALS